jgi:membrane-associated phospholipid phosphatase
MHRKNNCLLLLSTLIAILSLTALLINFFIYQYPANNYFADETVHIGCSFVLFYLGLLVLVGKNDKSTHKARELIYYYAVMCLIAFATNAVQLTPFAPIDTKIVEFEALVHINLGDILAWTHKHPNLDVLLRLIYDSLPYQMFFVPVFVLVMGRFQVLREYYFLLLLTTLLGFSFYYFYPTSAPASVINSPFFNTNQIATGLKFNQIRNHIHPSTAEGGLISLPSFHCIWALLCVYLLKEWLILCIILFLINIILIASCVLIGWHYPSDILAGFLLVALGYYFLKKLNSLELKDAQPASIELLIE